MGDDDKELTEDEINRLFSADFLYDSEPTECEPDAEALAKLDDLDAFDRFVRMWSDDRSRVTSLSALPVSAIPTPVTPELPVEVATEPSEIGSTIGATDFFDKVPLRSTIRKAGRFLPNCFGSESLHDPESADCGPCKFSEGCKKAIVDEMPVYEAARKAREAHFKPSSDPAQLKSRAIFLRERHLRAFRKSLEKRLEKDRIDHRVKREKASAEIRIKREAKKRFAALRSATAKPGKDKRVEQLRGRETMIMAVWAARQHARLIHGPGASDAQVATTFEKLGGGHFTRDQARSYRLLFKRLGNPLKKTPPKIPG